MDEFLIGIDVGSYSTKGIVCSPNGEIFAEARTPHQISFPKPGFAEHDAEKIWWADFVKIVKTLIAKIPSGGKIAGLGISGVGPCVLPLDDAGKPLRPAILYGIDTRTANQIAYLERIYSKEKLLEFGGTRLSSQSGGPKILWIKQNEPDIYRKTAKFVTTSTFLIHKLTGKFVIDRHTASYFNPLYNIYSFEWDERFAGEIVDLNKLPAPGWSDEIAGFVNSQSAYITGIPEGTPVSVGAVDGLAEGISVGVINPGDLMIMYGSTAGFYLPVDQPRPTKELWIVAGALKGQFAYAGGLATSGAATTWFRDQLGLDLLLKEKESNSNAYAELAQEGAASPPGANGLLMLPYLSGERTPLFDTKARGIFAGLTLAHSRADMYRALLEGTAFAIRTNLDAMQCAGAKINRIVAVGGGAENQLWLQIVSDICGIAQVIPMQTIGACYGDALLAGLAVGSVNDISEINRQWVKTKNTIKPNTTLKADYDLRYQLFKDLYKQTKRVIHCLADLYE